MQTNWWKIAVIAIVGALLFGLGFYIGRKRDPDVVIKEKIEYVELPPIHDTIDRPVPYKVTVPADTANVILEAKKSGKYADLFPIKGPADTVYITKQDTSAVIKDWGTERFYSEKLFDSDTLGRMTVNASVKYNRLSSLDYEFIPIQKVTEKTVRSVRKFLPYVGAGLTTGGHYMGQGGVFFNQDAGFAVQYLYDSRQKQGSVGAAFMYMF